MGLPKGLNRLRGNHQKKFLNIGELKYVVNNVKF